MGWIRRPKQSPFDVDSTKDRRTSRARKVERSHRAGGANDAGRNKTRRRRNDTERANEEKGEEGRAGEVSQRAYSLREVEESSIIAVSSVLALSSCSATQILRLRGKLTGPTLYEGPIYSGTATVCTSGPCRRHRRIWLVADPWALGFGARRCVQNFMLGAGAGRCSKPFGTSPWAIREILAGVRMFLARLTGRRGGGGTRNIATLTPSPAAAPPEGC